MYIYHLILFDSVFANYVRRKKYKFAIENAASERQSYALLCFALLCFSHVRLPRIRFPMSPRSFHVQHALTCAPGLFYETFTSA